MTNTKRIRRARRSRKTVIGRVGDLIEQGLPLRAIAAREGMPPLDTLHRWMANEPGLRDRYVRGKDARIEHLADEAVALADALAGSKPAGVKLRIEVRKWRVALMGKEAATKNSGHLDEEMIERLNAAHKRVAEYYATVENAPPSDAPVVADEASCNADQSGDGDVPNGVVPPRTTEPAATDNSAPDDAKPWYIAFPPNDGGAGDGVSGDKLIDDSWR